MKKIVFIDVDGTLVLPDESISENTIKACQQAKANGHLLFLCTGRSKAELFDHILEIGFDGLICAGGGYAEIRGKTLFHQKVENDEVKRIVDFFDTYEVDFYVESNGGLYASKHCVSNLMRRTKIDKKEKHPFVNALIEGADLYRDDVNKICFLEPEKVDFETIQKTFENSFEVMHCTVPAFGKDSGELAVKGVSKEKAIKEVLNALDMKQEQTIAIGDGLNDIDMITYCNVGIAMGNGKDGLKEVADYVCESQEDDGFYHAFEKYHLI